MMESSLCRVCLGYSKNMVNIFEELELGVSIGSMIAECTGYTVEKGDLFRIQAAMAGKYLYYY